MVISEKTRLDCTGNPEFEKDGQYLGVDWHQSDKLNPFLPRSDFVSTRRVVKDRIGNRIPNLRNLDWLAQPPRSPTQST